MPRFLLLTVLPLLVLAGCHHAAPVPPGERLITPTVPTVKATIDVHRHLPESFDNSDWLFAQVDDLKIHDDGARLAFRGGRLSGGTGCNRLSGSYTRQDNRLQLGEMAMTRMFCADKAGQEERIGLSLQKAQFAAIVKANGYLLLLDERREILAELAPASRQD